MEAMEVEPPVDLAGGAAAAGRRDDGGAPGASSDSGSSTEVDEEDADVPGGARAPPRPPSTWAFSRRAAGQGALIRRRLRQGLRVHYPSQTAAPSRGLPDFLLRAPAASGAEPGSGSSTEVSGSEGEEEGGGSAAGPAPTTPLPVAPPPQGATTESSSVPDGSRTTSPVLGGAAAPAAGGAPAALQEDGDGDTCSICLEAWTAAGDHRLAALRCGHLFGSACIQRWLRAQGPAAKCPQCNKKAKRSDVVLLYAPRLRAVDNGEQETLRKSLEAEQSLRRKAELETAQYKLRWQVVTDKYGQVQQELQELKALMVQTGGGAASPSSPRAPPRRPGGSGQYGFSRAVLLSPAGGCRVLSYCAPLSCLLASQPSPHAALVPGCGVKKVSVLDVKTSQYVPVHSKQIRGLSFNRRGDSLLLSGALDGTVKLTSLLTNTVVQTYQAGRPVWSCCWGLDSSHYVYAGLSSGAVLVYDTRDTSAHVQELPPPRSRCPVASLCYVPRAASSCFPCGGLIAGSLEGGCFWEQVDDTTYRPHLLPLEAAGCTDIQVEAETRHCLVTYRPGRSNPSLRCVLMALDRTLQPDAAQPPTCSCTPVQTFSAGPSCKLLTKNAVFRRPDGCGTLVCAGDEASNSTMVWDAGSGSLLQKLPADLPVLDICPFSVNGENFLASLTEKMMKLYRWE